MIKGTITINKEFKGINIKVDGNLNKTDKALLKKLGYKWHRRDKYFYTQYSASAYEKILTACKELKADSNNASVISSFELA